MKRFSSEMYKFGIEGIRHRKWKRKRKEIQISILLI